MPSGQGGRTHRVGYVLPHIIGSERIRAELRVQPKPAPKPRLGTKLSEAQVTEIRHLHESLPRTHTYQALAEQFGVSRGYVKAICTYRARVKTRDGSFGLA